MSENSIFSKMTSEANSALKYRAFGQSSKKTPQYFRLWSKKDQQLMHPYRNLGTVSITPDGKALTLIIANNEMRVIGKNLLPIMKELQYQRLDFIRELPDENQEKFEEDKTIVNNIIEVPKKDNNSE